jgi:acid phosphatase family membrane protein YuiD
MGPFFLTEEPVLDIITQFIPKSLLIAGIVQVLCQLFKMVFYSLKEKKFKLDLIATTGGMPSSHSAFVSALTAAVALTKGLNSDFFAISFVFAVIVIFDSFRLRGTVQQHSILLKKIYSKLPDTEHIDIPQKIGHSVPEILAGMITGISLAILLYFFI